MPALNQQEGTFTTLQKRVVPTKAALGNEGYELADIAAALGIGIECEYVVDLTPSLPEERGFRRVEFDSLENGFGVDGSDRRGYELEDALCDSQELPLEPDELESFDGTIIYRCDEKRQFNPFTAKCSQLSGEKAVLKGSAQFAAAAKLEDGERVSFEVDGIHYERVFSIDTSMKGTVALNPTFDIGLSSFAVSSYRFSKAQIKKVGSDDE
jgi:NADH-quinone oxidoreductase subunit G